MKEWMGTLLMPTKHVCILRAWKLWLNITTPTEINGWRPTQLSSIFIASYLFSSKGNTYWRYQPFPTLSFNCWGLYIKHVSFWNGVKSSLEWDFWYFFCRNNAEISPKNWNKEFQRNAFFFPNTVLPKLTLEFIVENPKQCSTCPEWL